MKPRLILSKLVCCIFLVSAVNSWADKKYEEVIGSSLNEIKQANISETINSIEGLIEQYPNSKLGHLLLADLLAAKAGAFDLVNQFTGDQKQLSGLRDELRYRWLSLTNQTPAAKGLIPANLITSAPSERYILVADAKYSRLYIFENMGSSYELIADYFMTVGKEGMGKNKEGDLRTPIGVYHVTSYLPDEELPPRYGPGAFPINYPNIYDKRLKRTGYGIWIHGTEPENYNRVPLASDGCLSLSNDEFIEIQKYVSTDGTTPIIISDSLEWISQDTRNNISKSANAIINQWKSDWESLNTEQYLSHYSPNLFENYQSFAERKRIVNKGKRYIEIDINNLSIYAYPEDSPMLLVSFDQEYRSDNHHSVTQKRQYWKESNGKWQIIYEG